MAPVPSMQRFILCFPSLHTTLSARSWYSPSSSSSLSSSNLAILALGASSCSSSSSAPSSSSPLALFCRFSRAVACALEKVTLPAAAGAAPLDAAKSVGSYSASGPCSSMRLARDLVREYVMDWRAR